MEKIKARVKKIRFYNNQNGFVVAEAFYKKKNFSIVGNSQELSIGEYLICEGDWSYSQKYKTEQFKAKKIEVTVPDEEEDIKEYLEQGLIKGIGPSMANKIINLFGRHFFEVLEENPKDLLKIDGIGERKLNVIIESWRERQHLPKIKKELESYGFEFSHVIKLYKIYGVETLDVLKNKPYSVLADVKQLEFKEVDYYALNNGIKKEDPSRVVAGFFEVLKQNEEKKSHTIIEKNEFVKNSQKILSLSCDFLKYQLEKLKKEELLYSLWRDGVEYIQSFEAYQAEDYIAKKLLLLSLDYKKHDNLDVDIKDFEKNEKFKLTEEQKEAIKVSIENRISVITGGPGVGKTTVLKFILKLLKNNKESVMLCAPTGRAAQRMTETTGQESSTIHRALGYNPQYGLFEKNEMSQFEVDNIILDETSMVDLYLMCSLLRAVNPFTRIILIGDVNQIASIGAGKVLKDIIESKKIPMIKMNNIHRQAANSKITLNAYRVNEGNFILPNNKDKREDFYFISTKNDEETFEKIKTLVTKRLPDSFCINSKDEVQILTPVHDGLLGTISLNKMMQSLLNPITKNELSMKRGHYEYRENDNIIQLKNDYEKLVFNGDMGYISYISMNELGAVFDDREIIYEKTEIDEISLSYAKTMHKSQGSEYNFVIIPISHDYKKMVDRSLYYTAITRGKVLVVTIGSIENLKKVINNKISRLRLTDLKNKLLEDI